MTMDSESVDNLKIAVAHEWVSARAGSEKTFEAIAQAFPQADLYALSVEPGIELHVGDRSIDTTFLDRFRATRDHRAATLPLMPLAWRLAGRTKRYDLVISSSHACVKGFRPGRSATHLSYVHAPMRYAWSPEIDGRGSAWILAPARAVLKRWDLKSVGWVDSFAANSREIAERVKDCYSVDARVIYPPVETEYFRVTDGELGRPRRGLLAVGRLIPYKRFDLVIRAAHELREPLTIAGRGPEEASLRDLAADLRADVRFEISPADQALRDLYRSHEALLFPGLEDFGIIPVEAQAAGTPVVGLGRGGLLDTVLHGRTGYLLDSNDPEALAAGVRAMRSCGISETACRSHAESFSKAFFIKRVRAWAAEQVATDALSPTSS